MELDNFLSHHGVKGMKWGVRKNYQTLRNNQVETATFKTKDGKEVTLIETKNGRLSSSLGSISPRFRNLMNSSRGFKVTADGKNIGRVAVREKSKEEVNFVWVGVNKPHRGQGYASTIFDAGVDYAKSKGYSKITLEVPGNAPDARHIYEKRGFKENGPMIGHKGDIWGGLTPMTLDISGHQIKHTDTAVTDDEMELALEQTFGMIGIDDISHSDEQTNEFLSHHGVKGMRWGQRKERRVGVSKSKGTEVPASDDAKKANTYHNTAHHHGTAALSNQELQHLVNRLNLEQQYQRMRPATGKEKGVKFVSDLLVSTGKQQASRVINETATKHVTELLKNH